jgi:nitroreductase
MTPPSTTDTRVALRRAAVRATLAPSIHNTQPWRFVLADGTLEIRADRSRQLRVLDPFCRQLTLSCGCALFNARVSLAAAGCAVRVERFPEPADPDLLARLTVVGEPSEFGDPAEIAELDAAVEQRRSNRRRFADEEVPRQVVDALVDAAVAEGAELFPIVDQGHRITTALLTQRADESENADPAYRAELRAWTSDDPAAPEGVPSSAVPYVDGTAADDIPIRDFDPRGTGALPAGTHSSTRQCLLLLGAQVDNREAWLRAGEALERVLLETTRLGYAASLFTQVIEVASTNEMLRRELGITMHPHVLMRVGRAPATPTVRRRRLVEVLTEIK